MRRPLKMLSCIKLPTMAWLVNTLHTMIRWNEIRVKIIGFIFNKENLIVIKKKVSDKELSHFLSS